MSVKQTGTWREFREARDWISSDSEEAEKSWVIARDLQALGYAEFRWRAPSAWAITPTVMTMLPDSGGTAFLTGRRTQSLVNAIETYADDLDDIDYALTQVGNDALPDSLFLSFRSDDAAASFARTIGADFTHSVAELIASRLPTLASCVSNFISSEFPRNFPRQYFDVSDLRWLDVPEGEASPGLYKIATYGHTEYRLVTPTRQVLQASLENGMYEALRYEDRGVLDHDPAAAQLRIPAVARIPALQTRAVTLCSGLPPRTEIIDNRLFLVYDNVNEAVGIPVMSSLAQWE
jgi:hypothetical protein